jgi:sigma non-opioid intracellular receptor
MSHIFDPQVLQQMAMKRIGVPHKQMVASIIEDLATAYPGHIETRQDWFFNIAGGATGIMTVLHASLSEYLILFGSPVGTEGFSGRYRIDIYDVVLAGEMCTYSEDNFAERIVYRPGDLALLRRHRVKGFRLLEGCWLLEYGRGPIPTCLPMALSGAFASLDGGTLWKTMRIYCRLVMRELFHGKI